MCAGKESTYDILGDVYDAAASVAGGLIHIGGDEAIGVAHDDFLTFVRRAATLVTERGRRVMAWHEAAAAGLPAGSVVQYWGVGQAEAVELARRAVADGAELVLSPGNRTLPRHEVRRHHPIRARVGRHGAGQRAPTTGIRRRSSPAWRRARSSASSRHCGARPSPTTQRSTTWCFRASWASPRSAGRRRVVRSWDGYRQRLAAQASALGRARRLLLPLARGALAGGVTRAVATPAGGPGRRRHPNEPERTPG